MLFPRLSLLFLLLLGGLCFAAEESMTPQEQLEQLDAELEQLHELQNRYKAAAVRHEDEGMRWQFMQNEKQEAKRAFEKADQERQKVEELQTRIDALEGRRKELLEKNPMVHDNS